MNMLSLHEAWKAAFPRGASALTWARVCAGTAASSESMSSGAYALEVLFDVYHCSRVRLYGFGVTNLSLPYHYWQDGSIHDGASAKQWYAWDRPGKHDFMLEHEVMYNELGNGSWEVHAST